MLRNLSYSLSLAVLLAIVAARPPLSRTSKYSIQNEIEVPAQEENKKYIGDKITGQPSSDIIVNIILDQNEESSEEPTYETSEIIDQPGEKSLTVNGGSNSDETSEEQGSGMPSEESSEEQCGESSEESSEEQIDEATDQPDDKIYDEQNDEISDKPNEDSNDYETCEEQSSEESSVEPSEEQIEESTDQPFNKSYEEQSEQSIDNLYEEPSDQFNDESSNEQNDVTSK